MLLWVVLVVMAIGLFGWVALSSWARWLSGRYGAPRWLRATSWVFLAMAALHLVAHLLSFRGLSAAADRGVVEPADHARLLANGISEAMNTLFFSGVLAMAGAVAMLVLTWTFHWRVKSARPEGSPPYR